MDLEISENRHQTALMLTWLSLGSQEKEREQAQLPLVLAERAVDDSFRSTRARRDWVGLSLKVRGE
ncbi:MAG: hypothetical protein CK534_06460 [Nitrospirae bacterium]|nr:MAG: hypothetical protein CK534_06460 [Nitrospirota bacterium]